MAGKFLSALSQFHMHGPNDFWFIIISFASTNCTWLLATGPNCHLLLAEDFKSLNPHDDEDDDEDDATTTCSGTMIDSWSELSTSIPGIDDAPQIKSLGDKKLQRLAEQMRAAYQGSSLKQGDTDAKLEPAGATGENPTCETVPDKVKDLGDQLKALVDKAKSEKAKPSQELPPHVAWIQWNKSRY